MTGSGYAAGRMGYVAEFGNAKRLARDNGKASLGRAKINAMIE